MPESKVPTTKDALEADAVLAEYNKLHPAPIIFYPTSLTDVGNAHRLVEKYGQSIHYVSAWKAWMFWNGKIWERLDEDKKGFPQLLIEWAKETANAYRVDADTIPNPELAREYRKHAERCESDAKIKAMLNLITGERGVIKSYKDFDNKPFLFSCQNGTLNLLTQEFRPHKREDYMTKISPVRYDPLASCPLWLSFLARIMRSSPEVIEYIQNIAGQCLTGEVREKSFYIFWGSGGDNGKTTLIEALKYILDEYAQTIPINALIKENTAAIPVDLHSLRGARFAFASEPNFGDTLTDGLIKRITGKDTMKTRTLHEKPTEWNVQFKLVIATNNKPRIPDASGAMWSRVKCVPFIERIPPEEQDKQLGKKLQLEASGILNWMLAGCRAWLANGMKEPEIVTQTVQEYREGSDKLAEWFDYCFEKKYDGFVPFKIYYPLYKLWCANHEIRPVQENTLPVLLDQRGFQNKRGWYNNLKGEKVRDRGCFGFQLKSWLSGVTDKTVTEIKEGKLVDRLSGQTIISPIKLILEAIDSDYETAKFLMGQVDRQNLVDSIYFVSCENMVITPSNMSNVSHNSDIPIFTSNFESVQSVQSVQNNINNRIIQLLKESFDSESLDSLIEQYGNVEEVKLEMERILLRLLDEIPDNINLRRYIDEYWEERDKNSSLPLSQREKIKQLNVIISQQQAKNGSAEYEAIISEAESCGVSRQFVTDLLQRLKTTGEIIEVNEGKYRLMS